MVKYWFSSILCLYSFFQYCLRKCKKIICEKIESHICTRKGFTLFAIKLRLHVQFYLFKLACTNILAQIMIHPSLCLSTRSMFSLTKHKHSF